MDPSNWPVRLVAEAEAHLGSPTTHHKGREWGTDPKTGFDCSGFVIYLLRQIAFPFESDIRHANELFDRLGVLVHFGLHMPGDLIFFSYDGVRPTHTGVVVASNVYIHSGGYDGERIERIRFEKRPIPHPSTRYPLLYAQNPIGFKRLAARVEGERWHRMVGFGHRAALGETPRR